MNRDYDIIVIGSGVGGGTFVDYLTKVDRGLKILILEAGPHFDRFYFNQKEIDMTKHYINRGAVLSDNLEIGVAAAKMVGGSSAVYTGVSFRTPDGVLKKWKEEHGIDLFTKEYVENSFDEIEKDISIHELPESWDNKNNQLFKEGAQALGLNVKRLKINTENCLQQGFCNLGCTSGAKKGTLEVQIPRVMNRGVELISNAHVSHLEEGKVFFELKDAPKGAKENQYSSGKYELTAKKIVIAAGVLNTPAILLRSKKPLGLKNDSIGRYLTLHPAINLNAIYKDEVLGFKGFPKTVYVDDYSDSDHFYLETSFYYPGITSKNIPGYGTLHQEFMKDYSKMMSILILIHDQAERNNRIAIDKNGNTKVIYQLNPKAKKNLVKAIKVASEIFFKAGCVRASVPGSIKNPLSKKDADAIDQYIQEKHLNFNLTPMSSAHPQGGARMGINSEKAVCDLYGKVYGTKSIYVCDASLFPSSVKVNPYQTIMLFAKKIAEQMLKEF